jgi:O-antigen/teichoic acid export membrane protein
MSVATLRTRVAAVRSDPLMTNSVLMLATTMLMAGGGALFWILAARLQSPANVGLAGSLVASAETIALFAQLGLNIALVRTLPRSRHQAADMLTTGAVVVTAATAFALVYALLLPVTSPDIAAVLHSPWTVLVFCALVAASALNVLTDSMFLGLNKLRAYLQVNGILLNVVKLGLPFLLAGAGALGLYGAIGGAAAVCALASLWVVLRAVPRRRSWSPSTELLEARKFAGAGYVTYALTVAPLLVFPLLVMNALGAPETGAYFVSFQVAMLLHAIVLTLANAAYAELERASTGRHRLVRKSAVTLIGASFAGAVVMWVVAPYLLWIFGDHYVEEGTATLRVLALAVVCAAYNYWGALRLRLSRHLRAMVLVQLVSTVTMLGLGAALVPRGTEWVAVAWGLGHLVGGLVGHVASVTVARFEDSEPEPVVTPEPA